MPLFYLRRLTGRRRTESANRQLARYLAFIAGAANAGGLLAVGQYTSHMSGVVSSMADHIANGSLAVVLSGLVAVSAFVFGAFTTAISIRWARVRGMESEYALPLLGEAILLTMFGVTGRTFSGHQVLGTVMLLCFSMGMQNAMITKLSNSVIRTTHVTGMLTDIGIALGRMVFATISSRMPVEATDLSTLRLLTSLVFLFFVGGVAGALGFKHVGFLFTLPLAFLLLLLAAMPVIDDMRRASEIAA